MSGAGDVRVLAIDQGTTGSTAMLLDGEGAVVARGYAELPQHFPQPGWVEHDGEEIWEATLRAVRDALARDPWLHWKLTGGRVHATDPTNASRTLLYDIRRHGWDDGLLSLFRVPRSLLPEVRPSAGDFGVTRGLPGIPDGVPIRGMAGDQQAALFGQGE